MCAEKDVYGAMNIISEPQLAYSSLPIKLTHEGCI